VNRHIVISLILYGFLSGLAHSQTYAFRAFRTGQSQAEVSRYLKLVGYSPLVCQPFDKGTGSTECKSDARWVPKEIRFSFNRFGLTSVILDFPSSEFNKFLNETVVLNGQPTKPLHWTTEPLRHTTYQVVEWNDRAECPCESMQIIHKADGTDNFFIMNGPLTVSGFPH
jgi:hypothetical protein